MLYPSNNILHGMQNICRISLSGEIDLDRLPVIKWREQVPPQQLFLECDVKQQRVTHGSTSKRQANALSLRALSFVLGTSPAGYPIVAPFGYEHKDWNKQASIRVGGEHP